MTGMLNDAFIWQSTNDNMQGGEHNEEVENFDRFMEEAKRPLYAGCNKYSRLSFVVHLFQLKCLHKWSNKSFSALLQLLKDVLPDGNVLPSTWYECRKMMSELGLECRKIHACPNDYVLFRNDFENLSKMRDYDFVDYEGMPAHMMEVIRFCKTSLQKKLRDWRCWLKSHYYVEGVPDEVLMKAPDKRVSQVNWDALLKFWESDKKVLEADRNKKNRGEDRATHTLGSKSIARHNQDLREQMGEDYTTLGAYIKAHQTKTGEYPDEYTRAMCVEDSRVENGCPPNLDIHNQQFRN